MTYPHDHDAKLDRILRGIANAEPREGFAQHLEANVQAAMTERQTHRPVWRKAAWCLPGLAASFAALLVVVQLQTAKKSQPGMQQTKIAALSSPLRIAPELTAAPARITPQLAMARKKVVAPQMHPLAAAIPSLDELAAEQMRAPSLPQPLAPPAPDGRRLQQVVEHSSAADIADLIPSSRDAALEREREEYQKFFNLHSASVIQAAPKPFQKPPQIKP